MSDVSTVFKVLHNEEFANDFEKKNDTLTFTSKNRTIELL